jgi:hypothetical protein
VAAVLSFGAALLAQNPAEPTAYTVTVQFTITGIATQTTYRLGSMVLVDTHPPDKTHKPTRTLYNLQTMESLQWDPTDPAASCVRREFHPADRLDFFDSGQDLTRKDIQHVGKETIHGIATEILEKRDHPDSFFRLWVDPKTGLMLKCLLISKKRGTPVLFYEVTDVSFTKPPTSIFETPASCNSAVKEPSPK